MKNDASKEELIKFLKENLQIKVKSEYHNQQYTKGYYIFEVKLFIGSDCITAAKDTVKCV